MRRLKAVKQLLADVNAHYSADNISKRDAWMNWVIDNLRCELETFKAALIDDFNTLVDKLQSCARAQDLVDEQGGSLDEFLESFRRY